MYYIFTYNGIERKLPVYEVSGGVKIAYLDTFSDLELVNALSEKMAEFIQTNPEYQKASRVVILTAVSKGVPFAYSVSNRLLLSCPDKRVELAIARKEDKKFFGKTIKACKTSITSTEQGDVLVLTEKDVEKLRGASVIVLDDMYSTGASIVALEEFAQKCNATVIDRVVAVWEVGDDSLNPPVKYVVKLPLIK